MSTPPTINTEIEQPADNSQNHMMLVALYLVLLAFFILLNALAFTDNQRSEKAISSVNAAFKAKDDGIVLLTKAPKSLSMEIIIKRHYDHLKKMAQDYINAQDLNIVQRGKVLEVTFPSTALFLPDRALIRDDKRAFIKHVSASVYPGIPSTTIEVSITGTSRNYLSDSLTPESKMEILRIGALARYISINRVPKSQIFTGMTKGKENLITLRFEIVSIPQKKKGNR